MRALSRHGLGFTLAALLSAGAATAQDEEVGTVSASISPANPPRNLVEGNRAILPDPCVLPAVETKPGAVSLVSTTEYRPVANPGEPNPGLAHDEIALSISLTEAPGTGSNPEYELAIDVISAISLTDVRLMLRMPDSIQALGYDGQTVQLATLSGYLRATPAIDYGDYRVGLPENISGPGLQRFRFGLANLPPLGQIEATVRAREVGSGRKTGSFTRIVFGSGQPTIDGKPVLFTTGGAQPALSLAQVWDSCRKGTGNSQALFRQYLALADGGALTSAPQRHAGPPDGSYCVVGKLRFKDIGGNLHPVPRALVKLTKGPPANPTGVLFQKQTEEDGSFEFQWPASGTLPEMDIKFGTLGTLANVYSEDLKPILGSTSSWSLGYWASSGGGASLDELLVPGICLDVGEIVADPASHQDNNYAFEVFSALQSTTSVINSAGHPLTDSTHPQVAAVFPNPLSLGVLQGISLFRKDDGHGVPSVLVAGLDVHNWDIMLHELAHYAQFKRAFPEPAGMGHSVFQNHCDSKVKLYAVLFSWYESWPTAMGMASQKLLSASLDGVPTLKDGSYDRLDIDGAPLFEIPFEPGANPLPSYSGEATEFALISAVWETFKQASFSDTYTPPAAASLVNTDYSNWVDKTGHPDVWNFSLFSNTVLPALAGNSGFDPRIGELLQRHRVAPMFDDAEPVPAERLRSRWLFPLDRGPNCDAKTEDFPIEYSLRVYSDDHQQVIWQSDTSISRVLAAPVSALRTFLTGSGETLHWHPLAIHPCKKTGGSCDLLHASNPQTGEYHGAGWTMVDDTAVCPEWLVWALILLLVIGLVLLVLALLGGLNLFFLLLALAVLATFGWLLYVYWYCLFG